MIKLACFRDSMSSINGDASLVILDPPHELWPVFVDELASLSSTACKDGYVVCFCRLLDASIISTAFGKFGFKMFDSIVWHDPQPCYVHSSRVLRTHEHILVMRKGEPYAPNMKLGEWNETRKSFKKGVSSIGKWNGSRRTYVQGERKHLTSVIKCPRPLSGPLGRWQKPENLIRTMVEAYSRKSDLVIDPFCGSGTTGAACVATGRKYMISDIDKDAIEVTSKRLS